LRLHSVDSLANNNLGVLGITDIAAEYAVASFPPDAIARPPSWGDAGGDGPRAPTVALAGLARLAAG
jgi:hypothetical protein